MHETNPETPANRPTEFDYSGIPPEPPRGQRKLKRKHVVFLVVALLVVLAASTGLVSCSGYWFSDSPGQMAEITAYRDMLIRNAEALRTEAPPLARRCDKGRTKTECVDASREIAELLDSWIEDMDEASYPRRYEESHEATRSALNKLARGNRARIEALSASPISDEARDATFSRSLRLIDEGEAELDPALASYPPDINLDRG